MDGVEVAGRVRAADELVEQVTQELAGLQDAWIASGVDVPWAEWMWSVLYRLGTVLGHLDIASERLSAEFFGPFAPPA